MNEVSLEVEDVQLTVESNESTIHENKNDYAYGKFNNSIIIIAFTITYKKDTIITYNIINLYSYN